MFLFTILYYRRFSAKVVILWSVLSPGGKPSPGSLPCGGLLPMYQTQIEGLPGLPLGRTTIIYLRPPPPYQGSALGRPKPYIPSIGFWRPLASHCPPPSVSNPGIWRKKPSLRDVQIIKKWAHPPPGVFRKKMWQLVSRDGHFLPF